MLCPCSGVIQHFISDSSSSTKKKDLEKFEKVNMKKEEGDTEDDELINM
jgi:hypothetical protein